MPPADASLAYWILLLHVEDLSGRAEAVQMVLREKLREYVRKALGDARVRTRDCQERDRDTGLAVLVSSSASPLPLLREFVRSLCDSLGGHDDAFRETHHLSVRLGVHHGMVAVHGPHWSSRAINELIRLVEGTPAEPMRGGSGLLLVLSNAVHQTVVLGGHSGIRPYEYGPVQIPARESEDGSLVAWATVPHRGGPPRWATPSRDIRDESSPRTDPGGDLAESEGQPVPGISGPIIHRDFLLGAGGLGNVYAVVREVPGLSGPLAYKEYHRPDVLSRPAVLEDMVRFFRDLARRSPDEHAFLDSRLVWPLQIGYRGGSPAGYLMRRIPEEYTLKRPVLGGARSQDLSFLMNSDSYSEHIGLFVDDEQRLRLLKDLAGVLGVLHGHGIAVGDLSPMSILFRLDVWPRCLLLDCDSMRFGGHSALPPAETADWEVPEREKATRASDAYKFGLVALRLFNRDQVSTDSAALARHSDTLERLAVRSLSTRPRDRPALAQWILPIEQALAGCKPDFTMVSEVI
ncbi:hypothetical protein C6Y14_40020 [Streptomyces dioscori]|uniref:Protein kinase domain-containing protein n=1 Tax=Streptomyces dioscori TaxID=2109333 RepID=A0A2P8PUZ7_9ACTN|nr:hypothetical protein [Streptomyces dioscori]PSM37820.1 hypothetical protein C6Y14_40020 [Streptomyces dioscori]